MARPWRWISTDIGIAADLPFPAASGGFPANDVGERGARRVIDLTPARPKAGALFCEWIRQRNARPGRSASDRVSSGP